MKNELINILEKFNYPVFLQGSLNENETYPTSFFTFWNFESPDDSFYDNNNYKSIYGYWIYFYSEDVILVDNILLDVKKHLKEAGWIVNGNGIDVASDVTTHTGRMYKVYKIVTL